MDANLIAKSIKQASANAFMGRICKKYYSVDLQMRKAEDMLHNKLISPAMYYKVIKAIRRLSNPIALKEYDFRMSLSAGEIDMHIN